MLSPFLVNVFNKQTSLLLHRNNYDLTKLIIQKNIQNGNGYFGVIKNFLEAESLAMKRGGSRQEISLTSMISG
ncbi:hypothetical protein DXK91_02345 [Parageobacillus toebii]|nr:hypothetical protein CN643_15570 [Parageobacillus yumthangensis]PUF90176.1 hypothetical protein DCC82_15145 [Geobacillus sp. LYN3]RDV23478.1 hypothetical protein DXK91_02345 [Parageobacillus toebii]